MRVGIEAKLKNGILWEAAKRLGSAAALARHLEISPSIMGQWLHFNHCPDFENPNHKERYADIELKLMELTGCSLEEIFPPEIRNKAFQQRQKRISAIVEMPIHQLIQVGAAPQLPPAPDELLFNEDRKAIINHVLGELDPRQRQVVQMRFGLGPYRQEHILEDVARELNVSKNRVMQIEQKALNKLRHPSRSRQLKELI